MRASAFVTLCCSIALPTGCRLGYDALPFSEGVDQVGGIDGGGAGAPGSGGSRSSDGTLSDTTGPGGSSASGSGGGPGIGGATGTDSATGGGSSGGGSTSNGSSTGSGGSVGSGGSSSSGGSTSSGGASSGGATGVGGSTSTGGASSSGSGGTGGTGTGGAGTGGAGTGGAGTTGTGGTSTTGSGGAAAVGADYIVTTSVDENDAGATASNPLGSGLSLREAITLANSTAGAEVIYVDVPTVSLTSNLTFVTDDLSLYGGGTTVTMSPAGSATCMRFEVGTHLIEGFILRDCDYGIFNNSGTVIVRNNQIFDSVRYGYYNGGIDSRFTGNLLVRTDGIGSPPTAARNTLWFNTIVDSTSYGFNPGQSSENDFRNNIITGSAAGGVAGPCNKYTYLSHNLFFGNVGADAACTPLVSSIQQDPLYAAPASDDYTLLPTSPAINAGTDLGLPYNGAAPDIGYWESP